MKLEIASENIEEYLKEIPPIIDFHSPGIREKIEFIKSKTSTDRERAKIAFEIARDKVSHSFDTQDSAISINAEDVLKTGNGICFAKSHLLASLLRGMNIPAGFCYQKVLRKGTVESGYALHGLNAIYLPEIG